jgi:hypothetical protein
MGPKYIDTDNEKHLTKQLYFVISTPQDLKILNPGTNYKTGI